MNFVHLIGICSYFKKFYQLNLLLEPTVMKFPVLLYLLKLIRGPEGKVRRYSSDSVSGDSGRKSIWLFPSLSLFSYTGGGFKVNTWVTYFRRKTSAMISTQPNIRGRKIVVGLNLSSLHEMGLLNEKSSPLLKAWKWISEIMSFP